MAQAYAKSKKGPDLTGYRRMKEEVKGKHPGNLYLFYGEEAYLRDHYLNQLKRAVLEEWTEEFNFHPIAGEDCTPQTLSEAIDTLPMMAERSLVLVSDADLIGRNGGGDDEEDGEKSEEDEQQKPPEEEEKPKGPGKGSLTLQTAYAEILADLPDYVCVVFLFDTVKFDRRRLRAVLEKALTKDGRNPFVEFAKQDENDLADWIVRNAKRHGKQIRPATAKYLILYTGGMLVRLTTEIEKLCSYAKEEEITQADIRAVCEPVLDAVVFDMTDDIVAGNFGGAAVILHDLISMETEPLMILGALGKQIRQLYAARVASEQGRKSDWLAANCGMQSWIAERRMRDARKFPAEWYRTAVVLIADTDRNMKLNYSQNNYEPLIDLLIRLAEAAKKR